MGIYSESINWGVNAVVLLMNGVYSLWCDGAYVEECYFQMKTQTFSAYSLRAMSFQPHSEQCPLNSFFLTNCHHPKYAMYKKVVEIALDESMYFRS